MAQWSKDIFARNLRRYMERAGKTQRDMAAVVGVSTATFSEWINAKKFPRIDKIEMLAIYFGVQKSDLIEDKPTAEVGDGLTANQRKLYELAQSLPDEQVDLLLQLVQSMLGNV